MVDLQILTTVPADTRVVDGAALSPATLLVAAVLVVVTVVMIVAAYRTAQGANAPGRDGDGGTSSDDGS